MFDGNINCSFPLLKGWKILPWRRNGKNSTRTERTFDIICLHTWGKGVFPGIFRTAKIGLVLFFLVLPRDADGVIGYFHLYLFRLEFFHVQSQHISIRLCDKGVDPDGMVIHLHLPEGWHWHGHGCHCLI